MFRAPWRAEVPNKDHKDSHELDGSEHRGGAVRSKCATGALPGDPLEKGWNEGSWPISMGDDGGKTLIGHQIGNISGEIIPTSLRPPSLESWLIRGIIPTWPYFSLVNYCNLHRYIFGVIIAMARKFRDWPWTLIIIAGKIIELLLGEFPASDHWWHRRVA